MSFDKIPAAASKEGLTYVDGKLMCMACAAEIWYVPMDDKQKAEELGLYCETCGQPTMSGDQCLACQAAALRVEAGVAAHPNGLGSSSSSSGGNDDPGPINGTYSSSGGPPKTSEQGAWTCSRCGKKTDHVVSGAGSGVYCSSECYFHRNDP